MAETRTTGSRDAVGWIGLAASPTLAVMAWITATEAPHICAQAASPIGGMAWMYLLMSLFHVSPWLRLAARQFPKIYFETRRP